MDGQWKSKELYGSQEKGYRFVDSTFYTQNYLCPSLHSDLVCLLLHGVHTGPIRGPHRKYTALTPGRDTSEYPTRNSHDFLVTVTPESLTPFGWTSPLRDIT